MKEVFKEDEIIKTLNQIFEDEDAKAIMQEDFILYPAIKELVEKMVVTTIVSLKPDLMEKQKENIQHLIRLYNAAKEKTAEKPVWVSGEI